MAKMARSPDIKLPLARLSYPHLFKPQEMKKTGGGIEKKYNATLLFPKATDLSAVRAAVLAVAKEQWGDKAEGWLRDGLIKHPFLDGDGPQALNKQSGERHPGYAGTTFMRVSANEDRRPAVVNKRVLPITDPDEAYPGCWVYAVVNFYAWINDQSGKGVSAGLSMIQVAKDDERLGGGGPADPTKHFETIADEGEAPAETKTGQGAAGFFA